MTAKARVLLDLEKLNTLNREPCPACGKNFELGEFVVLACGKWDGPKYIHEDESIFDKDEKIFYEKGYYRLQKQVTSG